ncbi:MAG TPA: hypothetical protein VK152_05530, partial [Paludibacter sp.]|nr:hypothetical protein [Paludibacter sp.]
LDWKPKQFATDYKHTVTNCPTLPAQVSVSLRLALCTECKTANLDEEGVPLHGQGQEVAVFARAFKAAEQRVAIGKGETHPQMPAHREIIRARFFPFIVELCIK